MNSQTLVAAVFDFGMAGATTGDLFWSWTGLGL